MKIRGDRPGGLSYYRVVPAQNMIRAIIVAPQELHQRTNSAMQVRKLAIRR